MIALPELNSESRKTCFEFRVGIEGEAAACAARQRTDADLDRLENAIRRLELIELTQEFGLEEDFAFHMAVARASHNDYFVSVLQSFRSVIFEGMVLARATSGFKIVEKISAINQQHREVFVAIVNQDAAGARIAMRSHLERCKTSTRHWHT